MCVYIKKNSTEYLLCCWHLPPLQADWAREHQNTAEQEQHVVFDRAKEGEAGRQAGKQARRQAGLHSWIFTVLLSWRAESMNGWNKTKQKRRPTIYCMLMKPRLIQPAHTSPSLHLFRSLPLCKSLSLLICMHCVQMHPLIVLSMPGLLFRWLIFHQ